MAFCILVGSGAWFCVLYFSQFAKRGTIPLWRLILWVSVAMAGVAYFTGVRPEAQAHRFLFFVGVVLTGAFLTGFGLILNWEQSEQARAWFRQHRRLVSVVFTIVVLLGALLKFWDISSSK